MAEYSGVSNFLARYKMELPKFENSEWPEKEITIWDNLGALGYGQVSPTIKKSPEELALMKERWNKFLNPQSGKPIASPLAQQQLDRVDAFIPQITFGNKESTAIEGAENSGYLGTKEEDKQEDKPVIDLSETPFTPVVDTKDKGAGQDILSEKKTEPSIAQTLKEQFPTTEYDDATLQGVTDTEKAALQGYDTFLETYKASLKPVVEAGREARALTPEQVRDQALFGFTPTEVMTEDDAVAYNKALKQKNLQAVGDIARGIALGSGQFSDAMMAMFGRQGNVAAAPMAIMQQKEQAREKKIATGEQRRAEDIQLGLDAEKKLADVEAGKVSNVLTEYKLDAEKQLQDLQRKKGLEDLKTGRAFTIAEFELKEKAIDADYRMQMNKLIATGEQDLLNNAKKTVDFDKALFNQAVTIYANTSAAKDKIVERGDGYLWFNFSDKEDSKKAMEAVQANYKKNLDAMLTMNMISQNTYNSFMSMKDNRQTLINEALETYGTSKKVDTESQKSLTTGTDQEDTNKKK